MLEDVPVEELLKAVRSVVHDYEDDNGASRVEVIVAAERVIRAAQALQLEQISAFHADRRANTGLFDGDPLRQVAGEVSLARNVSPTTACNQVGVALGVAKLPSVAAALKSGVISEPTVRAIAHPTQGLSKDDLVVFDAEIAPQLAGLTPRRGGELAERIVISLDPELAADQADKHRKDVRVDLIAESDGLATLNVLGPAEKLTAVHESLRARAMGKRVEGDETSSLDQLMFDALVERVTGAFQASDTTVEVGLVMDVATFLGTADHPVELIGHGPIAPAVADDILSSAHRVFYRRLVTDPITHTLVARDERRRRFDGPLAGYIRSRDRHRCRQPGCDCRIRDLDHVKQYSVGGLTRDDNGQGVCKMSHIFKHLPGWKVTAGPDGTITWRTPTGNTYLSRTPSLHPLAA
jgi:hypothetical protein